MVKKRVESPARADLFVREMFPGCGRRELVRVFQAGGVRVNGRVASKGQRLVAGDEIEVTEAPHPVTDRAPLAQAELPLSVLYEDDSLLAVNKLPGQPTHPLVAAELGTLANAVVARYPECLRASPDVREAGAAHRLDAWTSGVLVFAREPGAWRSLRDQFGAGRVQKDYLALVAGFVAEVIEITAPLARRKTRVIAGGGSVDSLPAHTVVTCVERYPHEGLSLVTCTCTTGRMHQVRAHLAYAGLPVIGDPTYGIAAAPALCAPPGYFLHARRIAFRHPVTGAPVEVQAPLPSERAQLLERLAVAR